MTRGKLGSFFYREGREGLRYRIENDLDVLEEIQFWKILTWGGKEDIKN